MDKRYQVFVSSTYADLKEERQRVIQTLMEMDCIPSGMELFPAADEETWEFIKRVIDDCDYYLLIIGGRYGSITPEGISYTEKEYDYAFERGMKVIAFLHSSPEEIPVGKSEMNSELRERLTAFRNKVSTNRLVKCWKTADELPGLVALSMSKTIKSYPAVGWVRADKIASTELLNELNELRKKKEELEKELARQSETTKVEIPDLASLDEKINVFGKYYYGNNRRDWALEITWREVFALLSPHLLDHPNDVKVERELNRTLFEKFGREGNHNSLNDQVYQTIKIQLQALNLVTVQYLPATNKGMSLFWSLTKSGYALMMSLRTIKSVHESDTKPITAEST
jgi:hypothetical protein